MNQEDEPRLRTCPRCQRQEPESDLPVLGQRHYRCRCGLVRYDDIWAPTTAASISYELLLQLKNRWYSIRWYPAYNCSTISLRNDANTRNVSTIQLKTLLPFTIDEEKLKTLLVFS